MFKKARENRITHPKTTKKGIWIGLLTAIIGSIASLLLAKHPALSGIMADNAEVIAGGFVLIGGIIIERFAAKKDPV